jgi:hypothetical protein
MDSQKQFCTRENRTILLGSKLVCQSLRVPLRLHLRWLEDRQPSLQRVTTSLIRAAAVLDRHLRDRFVRQRPRRAIELLLPQIKNVVTVQRPACNRSYRGWKTHAAKSDINSIICKFMLGAHSYLMTTG